MPQVSFPLKSYALLLKLAEVEIELSCLNWNWTVYIYISFLPVFLTWLPDAPTVRMKSDPVYVNLGDTADLLCVADANPITYSMFSWKWMVSDVLVIPVLLSARFFFAYSHPFPTIWSFVSSAQSLSLFLSPLFISHYSLFLSDFSFLTMCHSYSVTEVLYFTLLTTTMSHLYA